MTGRERAGVPPPSGTVTFLFSDIEGSTQRWERDRAAMERAVRLHDRLMHAAIAAHAGYVFKTMGDAFCAAFATPESAARAALEAQRALAAGDFSAVDGLSVRIAINTGTADERDGDYFGPTVNRVARLLPLGHGGQVLLSGMAAGLVRENPPPEATLVDLGAHALRDIERPEQVYQLVAPGLRREFPALRTALRAPWLVPDAMHTRYFTGRDDLLARLRTQLEERQRAVLSGLGGVGKSQTAIEYAIRHRAEYPDGVFWVSAEAASGLTSGFAEIAKALRLPEAESADQEQAVRAVLDWLSGTDRWLSILDNVEERREVQRFVPKRGKGHILITSRETVFQELGIARGLVVGDLDDDESLRFLLARTERGDVQPGERAAAMALATELGNLPLALEQAAAYITETNASFADYLGAFRKRRVTLLEKASGLVAHDTVAVTWAANFEAVERASPAAADALRISAFLAPDTIPFELLSNGAPVLGDPIAEALNDPDDLAVDELLRPLARYSLIHSDAGSHTYGVHRLVQEIVREAIAESERPAYIDRGVAALNVALPEIRYENWPRYDRLSPHIVSIAAWIDSCGVNADATGRILNETGRYLYARGRYSEASELLERALAILQRARPPDDAEVAAILNGLATVRWYEGRYAEAQPLFERALALRERVLGLDHSDVAQSLNGLASTYWNQGRYSDAEPLFERALAMRERAQGPDHPDVATSLNNVAILYAGKGRYAEAQPLYERALTIRERSLGPDHPTVAASLEGLANVYMEQGSYDEAQPLFERALRIRELALGQDHPDVAYSLHNLADLAVKQGRDADAESLYERALATRKRAVGPDHALLAYSLDELAGLKRRQGRLDEAQALFERALAIREALGPDHPDLAKSLVGFASLRKDQGRDADAISLLERALTIKQRTLDASDPALGELQQEIVSLGGASTPTERRSSPG